MNIILSGGSRGLGAELVNNLLNDNHKVATFARSETTFTSDMNARFGNEKFLFEEIDMTDYDKVKQFVNKVKQQFGSINCLINNAAIGQDHLLTGIKDSQIFDIVNINLTSTIVLTKYVVKKMLISSEKSCIINISSICGTKGFTGLSVYSATKGGMLAFTRSLARELGGRNISVNSISPGFFESEMSAILSVEQLEIIKRRTTTGELVTPKQIYTQVAFLLQPNLNITGQDFIVDGGSTI